MRVIDTAIAARQLVIAATAWQRVYDVAMLPFLLHTCWADRSRELGLNATFALVPFSAADNRLTLEPRLDPELAALARYVARVDRNTQDRSRPKDFVHPDWEEGYQRHKQELPDQLLPARAFVAVDHVRLDGSRDSGLRPVLGKYATRGTRHVPALRPVVLVAPRRPTAAASRALAEADFLVVNIQGLRGARSLELVRDVLKAWGHLRPGMVVVSSPTDLLALDPGGDLLADVQRRGVEQPPAAPKLEIAIVEKVRLQTEERFRFAVLDLKGQDPDIDRLIPLAVAAWWSAHQRLTGPAASDHNYIRLAAALENLRRSSPEATTMLEPLLGLLQAVADDTERIQSRLTALVKAIGAYVNQPSIGSVMVVLRDAASGRFLAENLARDWGIEVSDLSTLGVKIVARPSMRAEGADAIVVNGYFGAGTVDDILRSRARLATMVLDPIESLALRRGLEAMQTAASGSGTETLAQPLRDLLAVIEPHVASFSPVASVEVGLGLYPSGDLDPSQPDPQSASPDAAGKVTVLFTDGSSEVVAPTTRFEVVAPLGVTVKSVSASDLEAGQEVLLTEGATEFSPRLLAALDAGALVDHARKRMTWLELAQSVVVTNNLTMPQLTERMRLTGVSMDPQTIRTWVRGTSGSVPDRWLHFVALAGALNIELPEQILKDFYFSIRLLRIRHRQAGRDLVRAMRASATGRLTASSLHRIGSTWGLSVRELVDGTRLAVVDDVIV